jgi:hypothetical protein
MGQACGTYWGELYIIFWWENLKEIDLLKSLGIDRRMILKCILKMWGGRAWTGLIWFKIGIIGKLL